MIVLLLIPQVTTALVPILVCSSQIRFQASHLCSHTQGTVLRLARETSSPLCEMPDSLQQRLGYHFTRHSAIHSVWVLPVPATVLFP